ncbi:hypothetical protein ABEB36_008028 [Hypothenemus hampei]|uniref:Uncharacterized protein n=1 Tax=Hypothenemus hampei TaxID=57062 RepID=A0ABD1EKG5_HYPHA
MVHLGRFTMWAHEVGFTTDGFFNIHNKDHCVFKDPHVVHEKNHQQRLGINVWVMIIGNPVFGLFSYLNTTTTVRILIKNTSPSTRNITPIPSCNYKTKFNFN